jgi:hypothetical protein
VYIKEDDKLRQNIIVNPTDTPVISVTPAIGVVITPEQTETVVQIPISTPVQTPLMTPVQGTPEKIDTSTVPRLVTIFIVGIIAVVAGFWLISIGKRKK